MNRRYSRLLACVALTLLCAVARASESDDLWAQALCNGLGDTNTTTEQVEALFLKAAQAAERKAPIYVTLGDYCRTAFAVSELADQTTREPVARTERGDIDHRAKALRYYMAAAAEDRKLAVAWFRIALNEQASDQLKRRARSNFIMWRSENALPHYLDACERMEQLPEALESLRRGNRHPLRVPRTPVPGSFRLAFPATKPYRDGGLAGKPVPPIALRIGAVGQDAAESGSLLSRFRDLARALANHGVALADEGRTEEAIRCLESVAAFGLKSVQNEGGDALLPLTGLAIVKIAAQELRPLYEAANQGAKVKRLDTVETARAMYRAEYSAFFKSNSEWLESDAEGMEAFRLAEEAWEREREMVLGLPKKTGLDTLFFED